MKLRSYNSVDYYIFSGTTESYEYRDVGIHIQYKSFTALYEVTITSWLFYENDRERRIERKKNWFRYKVSKHIRHS